jgi:sugar O-acyltransferase (sialic acid O-acetyltransferase NeuD family)
MKETGRRLVIVGDGELAEIAYEYFTYDSPHKVVGFAVERACLKRDTLCNLPVVPLEEVETHFAPDRHAAFMAVDHTQLNRVRVRLYQAVKDRGYQLVSYVSSEAFVWRNVEIGDNCFICENNVLQHHARIGNNVILWSGGFVGPRSVIGDHCFLAAHVVLAGACTIGASCFLDANSAVGGNVKVARDSVVGPGVVLSQDTEEGKVYLSDRQEQSTFKIAG